MLGSVVQVIPDAWLHTLGNSKVFGRLVPEQLGALLAEARERPMQRGEVLFRRGDDGASLVALLAGEVQIRIDGPDGREQVLRRLRPGEICGEIALLDGFPRTADAIAQTNGRLLVLERRSLLACMARDVEISVRLIEVLCDRLRSTSIQMETFLFYDVTVRLAHTLLSLVRDRPSNSADITQSALGEMVGATREWVNKRLRAWEGLGWVALQPGRVTVRDERALEGLLPPTFTPPELG